jgi:hypothetical protein
MKVIKYIILYLVPVPEPQLITVPVPTFQQVTVPVPVPLVKKLRFLGSGSCSTTLLYFEVLTWVGEGY